MTEVEERQGWGDHGEHAPPFAVVIVGGGPGGTNVLERLAANVPELLPGTAIVIHVVDPHPPGAGRVWRHEQSRLMVMNSMAADVTMFTDELSTCDGPIAPGPSLFEWAKAASEDDLPTPELVAEARDLVATEFPTRQLQAAYLGWVFRTVAGRFPDDVEVVVHRGRAVELSTDQDARQRVRVRRSDGSSVELIADALVLAMGHLDVDPDPGSARLQAFAQQHDLTYLPPAYTADIDLSSFQPGQHVIIRGMGLTFVDLFVLLTEGRGGRYQRDGQGHLTYLACGLEPILHVGSRRGLPHRAKMTMGLHGPSLELPRYCTAAPTDEILAQPRIDFRRDMWPLIAKEMCWGYYQELHGAHGARFAMPWEEFVAGFDLAPWGSEALVELVARAVPDPDDRFDPEWLDRPLAGLRFHGAADLQEHVRAHVAHDMRCASDPAHSALRGAFMGLLASFAQIRRVVNAPNLGVASRLDDYEDWFFNGFCQYFTAGAPDFRLEQLIALSEAGIVRFLGADTRVEADEAAGRFVARSASLDQVVIAEAMAEGRLPAPDLGRACDELLRGLHAAGVVGEEVLVDPLDGARHVTGLLDVAADDLRMVTPAGDPHPRRFAVGTPTNRRLAGTFARPRTDGVGIRQADALARALLSGLGDRLPAT